jgi:hypothetical protein
LDDVIGVTILGPHFASASAPYSVQTSAKTESVHILGGYNGNPNNDVGNAITDFRSPTFRGSGGVRADFASWTLDAPDNTKPPMLALKLAGASKGQLTLGSNGDLYLQHYNTNTLSMENVFNVNYKNEFKLYKAITGLRNESGATASRPAGLNNTTDKGYQFFDTTLGKPVWWAGANWKDATGVIV